MVLWGALLVGYCSEARVGWGRDKEMEGLNRVKERVGKVGHY